MAAYDEVIRRYGSSTEEKVVPWVASALMESPGA